MWGFLFGISSIEGEEKIQYVFKRTINLQMPYCAFQGASLQFEGFDKIGFAQF